VKVKGQSVAIVRMLSNLAGKIICISADFSCLCDSLKHSPSFVKMPAGRKSGKGSGPQTKSTGKSTRKPSSGGKSALGGAPGALQDEERCPTPPLLPASPPGNELEEAIDYEKLAELLSGEEPDSSECEYIYFCKKKQKKTI
jgi:hypothetical protein